MTTRSDLSASSELRDRRRLPHRLRLLFVGEMEPHWALIALRLESAGCDQAEFDWQTSSTSALARLRTTPFDCLLVHDDTDASRQKIALNTVEGLRSSGSDEPVVVVLSEPNDDRASQYDDLGCEVLVTTAGWQSQALTSAIRRAVASGDLSRDIVGLQQAARRGQAREREEAEGQLRQLRSVVAHLLEPSEGEGTPRLPLREPSTVISRIESYYRELLRTYVMMGSGNLATDLAQLAELFCLSGISPHEALAIHLDQVESLIRGLGNRSSRHVMARADLLALELMIHLGEWYRKKSQFRGLGDAGVDLLHAESLLQRTPSKTA